MPDGNALAPCAQFPSESIEFYLTQYSGTTLVLPAPRIVGRECDYATGDFILRSVVDEWCAAVGYSVLMVQDCNCLGGCAYST